MITNHHTSEKRLGRFLDKRQFSCMMYRATPADRRTEKPELLFEMEMRYCIVCNAKHWILGEPIPFEQPVFNPNDYWISELYEMGYFAQFDDTTAPND